MSSLGSTARTQFLEDVTSSKRHSAGGKVPKVALPCTRVLTSTTSPRGMAPFSVSSESLV